MGSDMPMPMSMSMPPMGMPVAPSTMANNSFYMNMDMGMMHSSFFWGKDAIILFKGWPNNNLGMYILALLFVFLLSFGVEILSLLINQSSSKAKSPLVGGLIHSVVYAVKMAVAYLVMLAVMSFNIGVFIVAVLGHATGGFLVKYWSLTNQHREVATPVDPLLPLSKTLPEEA